MTGAMDLSLYQMALGYVFVLILLAIVKIRGISREKEIIISTIRMTLQLTLVGYILVYILENPSPITTILVIIIMEVFAIFNVYKRTKSYISKPLKRIIAISMVIGTLTSLIYFLLVVIRIQPWYNPKYFIPIVGMLIGNSMTGITLGVSGLVDRINLQKSKIENSLMLGATPNKAVKSILDKSFDSAILPTINSMLGMGIVFLPGMMTGQILSGTIPTTAIKYQILIMLGILGSVTLTVLIFVQMGYKTFFNSENQLVLNNQEDKF